MAKKTNPTQTNNPLRTVAYLRVSTMDQDIEKNKSDILTFANDRKFGNVDFVE